MGRDAFRARHVSDQIDRLSDALRSSERRVRGLRRILRFYSTAARRIVPALAALKAVRGWVAEWSNAHAWKACLPQGNQGSNPCPSAIARRVRLLAVFLIVSSNSFAQEKAIVEPPTIDIAKKQFESDK